MGYHDDLIEHAIFLCELNPQEEPKLVNLRRSVSAAYYGLFHLLTTEAAENWKHPDQRVRFARMFDHGPMKDWCDKVTKRPRPGDPAKVPVEDDLKSVAEKFVKLQQARHTADYDNAKVWSRENVNEFIAMAKDAMAVWSNIRDHAHAQDFLLDLMGRRR